MTHRYNTRFQAKQTQSKQQQVKLATKAQQKQEAPQQAMQQAKQSIHSTSLFLASQRVILDKKEKELMKIKNLLCNIDTEKHPLKKVLIAIRIYHFLEYNHIILSIAPLFRNVVRTKAKEFISLSTYRTDTLQYIPQSSTCFTEAFYLTIVTEELKNICERVLAILDATENKSSSQ